MPTKPCKFLGQYLGLQGLVPDDISQGIVWREHDLSLVSSLPMALQRGARNRALLLAA